MLEDPAKGVIYVPISKALFDEMKEWSEAVQFKLERDGKGGFDLIFRRVEMKPVELSTGRAA